MKSLLTCAMVLSLALPVIVDASVPTDLEYKGTLTWVAGQDGSGGDVGTGAADPAAPQVDFPWSFVSDGSGSTWYVSDYTNNKIKKLVEDSPGAATYTWSVVGGTGTAAGTGDFSPGGTPQATTIPLLAGSAVIGGPNGNDHLYVMPLATVYYVYRIELSGTYNFEHVAGKGDAFGCTNHATGTLAETGKPTGGAYRKTDGFFYMANPECFSISRIEIALAGYPYTARWLGSSTKGDQDALQSSNNVQLDSPNAITFNYAETMLYFVMHRAAGPDYSVIKKVDMSNNADPTVTTIAGHNSGTDQWVKGIGTAATLPSGGVSLAWYDNYRHLVISAGQASGVTNCGFFSYEISTGQTQLLAGSGTCNVGTARPPNGVPTNSDVYTLCRIQTHEFQQTRLNVACNYRQSIGFFDLPLRTPSDTVTETLTQSLPLSISTSKTMTPDVPTPVPTTAPTPAPPTPAPTTAATTTEAAASQPGTTTTAAATTTTTTTTTAPSTTTAVPSTTQAQTTTAATSSAASSVAPPPAQGAVAASESGMATELIIGIAVGGALVIIGVGVGVGVAVKSSTKAAAAAAASESKTVASEAYQAPSDPQPPPSPVETSIFV